MSQPEISPLARRLAEENNVDWHGLHGSGAGGKVVERDVLEFLARVMAGEEDLDPTPEPVPEGMEAWPDEDVRSFQEEVRASRRDAGLDEIQQELSAADRLGDDIAGGYAGALAEEDELDVDSAPEIEEPESDAIGADAASDDISEDIFLFGDEGEDQDQPPPAAADGGAVAGWPQETGAEADDELLVAGEETFDVAAEDEDEHPSDGYAVEAGDLPDVFGVTEEAEDAAQGAAGGALFADDAEVEEPADTLDMPPIGDVGGSQPAADAGAGDAPFAFGGPAEEATGGAWPGDAWDESEAPGFGAGDGAEAAGAWGVEAGEAESPREPLAEEGWAASETFTPPAAGGVEEDTVPPTEPAEPPPDDARPSAVDVDDALAPGAVGVAGAAAVAGPGDLPLVSYGALLRRHLDVTALASAQLAVSLELGDNEPLSPAPFLLRAAAKAAAEGGWGDGTVAMVGFAPDAGLRLRRIDDAAQRPFVELARLLASHGLEDGDEPTAAALSVADMSALDVDEAVLAVGGPLLTLGRILYDNQRGSYRSTLSLAGEIPAERGARLLARVAELLDAPVRLLV